MQLHDLVIVSIRQMIRHRRRYLGVFLAIAFGVAGVITMVTMSREVKRNFNEDLNLIGGSTVIRASFDNRQPYRPQWFRDDTVEALRRLPGVKEISLTAMKQVTINWHGHQYVFDLMAVDDHFWGVRSLWAHQGRLLGPNDITGRKRECVVGKELAKKIFGTNQVIGQTLEINQEIYQISGVLGVVLPAGDLEHFVFLPMTTAQDRLTGNLLTDGLYLRCATWDDVAPVAAAIPGVVKAHQSTEELRVDVAWEALKRVQRMEWWIELFVYLAVTATFGLGGMSIWNVMMAAVVSRTREIGLKKAMGAEDRDILAQFLSEALCLSLTGALMGAALGRVIMELLALIIGDHPPERLFLLGLSLGLVSATILGVAAGLYPSLKASRMEVVTAVRYE